MLITQDPYRTYFDEFEVTSIVSEGIQYSLFKTAIKDTQALQLRIFSEMEYGLPMFNGQSFGNQVHFQNAYQTPVQRWFPYREGYSIKLVNAFIKELKIKGNIFDPFSGSGTTLLASRMAELNSFGIDVNPISFLVAKVENEQYTSEDIIQIEEESKKLTDIAKSKETFQAYFD